MDIKNVLSIISGSLCILGFIPYARAILAGTTKPAKATWIIWASLDAIILAGMYVENSINGLIIGCTTGAFVVAGLALKYGLPGWTKLDKFCITGAILGVVLWKMSGNPTLGIIISLTVMLIGSMPIFVSTYNDPTKEDKVGWVIFWLACVFALGAIPKLTWEDASQPIVFFVIETTMMWLLFIKPQICSKQKLM